MPRVVVEYDLPREQEQLEGAIMGPESARVIAKLRKHLEKEREKLERDVRKGAPTMHAQSELVGYLRGTSDALAELEKLARGQDEEEGRRIDVE